MARETLRGSGLRPGGGGHASSVRSDAGDPPGVPVVREDIEKTRTSQLRYRHADGATAAAVLIYGLLLTATLTVSFALALGIHWAGELKVPVPLVLLWSTPWFSMAGLLTCAGWGGWRAEGTMEVIEDGPLRRVPVLSYGPFASGFLAAFVVSLVACLLTSGCRGEGAAWWPPTVGLAAVAFSGFQGWFLVAHRLRSGRYDLVVDRELRAVALPVTKPRTRRLVVPFTAVQQVRVEVTTDPDGDKHFPLMLRLTQSEAARQGEDRDQPLFHGSLPPSLRAEAECLGAWLRAELAAGRGEAGG